MNKHEFRELQREIGETVVSYERFCKKGYLLDMQYTSHFHEYIEKEYRLSGENEALKQVLMKVKQQESPQETERWLKEFKVRYAQTIVRLSDKIQKSKLIAEVSEETAESMEQAFEAYAMAYHPAVRIFISKEEKAIYNQLRVLYMENKLSAFTALLEMNQNQLQKQEIEEGKYIQAAEYYYHTVEQIRLDMKKKEASFPYTKESLFEDSLSLAAEEAEFRVRLNLLSGLNKSLHKDITTLYGKDITL